MPEMTLGEAAARYGWHRRTLQKAIARGHLVARKLGYQWVVRDAAVERWLREGKHTPGPPKGSPAARKGVRTDGDAPAARS